MRNTFLHAHAHAPEVTTTTYLHTTHTPLDKEEHHAVV